MIGILIIAHGSLGESLIECASHVMGQRPLQLMCLDVSTRDDPADFIPRAQKVIEQLNSGDGVLVLSDMYGATPCNIVNKLIQHHKVEGIAGVNLPMLVRALSYRETSIAICLEKAISGGREGVVHLTKVD